MQIIQPPTSAKQNATSSAKKDKCTGTQPNSDKPAARKAAKQKQKQGAWGLEVKRSKQKAVAWKRALGLALLRRQLPFPEAEHT